MPTNFMDVATLTRHWWIVLMRGLLAIAFGLMALFAPGVSMLVLLMYFGAYAFIDGVLSLLLALRRHSEGAPWWPLVFQGLVGIGAGVLTTVRPWITAVAMLALIGAWFVVRGVLEVVAAVRLRKTIRGEWLLVLSGVLSALFGAFMLLFPAPGAVVLMLYIGAEALVLGALAVALSFRLHAWHRHHAPEIRPTLGPVHG